MADKINKVKNFLLFEVVYDIEKGKDENNKFDNANDKLDKIGDLLKRKTHIIKLNNQYEDIFRRIKEKLSNNEEKAQEFIQNLIIYYNIVDENLIYGLTILFKSKKYELDINRIIFFFENFEKDNKNWNEKLPPRDYKKSKEKSEEIDFQKFKDYLNILKKMEYMIIKI